MVDYSVVLGEISKSLQQIAQAPDYTWFNPIAVIASGVLGGVLAWLASQAIRRHHDTQRARENEARKNLVFQLLRDEIRLRWNREIQPSLRYQLTLEPLSALEMFAETELKGDDVFTFKSISTAFTDYHFLGDHCLVRNVSTRMRHSRSEFSVQLLR